MPKFKELVKGDKFRVSGAPRLCVKVSGRRYKTCDGPPIITMRAKESMEVDVVQTIFDLDCPSWENKK